MAKSKQTTYYLIGYDIVLIYHAKGLSVILEMIKEAKIAEGVDYFLVDWVGKTDQLESLLVRLTNEEHFIKLHYDEYLAIRFAIMNTKWNITN